MTTDILYEISVTKPFDRLCYVCYNSYIARRHDGIGRRTRLKIWGWFQRVGSIPTGGTIVLETACNLISEVAGVFIFRRKNVIRTNIHIESKRNMQI